MASKTVLLDDLDPTAEATETVLFSVDGVFTEIDLGEKNAAALRTALTKYAKAGRVIQARDAFKRLANGGNGHGEYDPTVVRAWAIAKGIPVAEKGRVSEEIVSQWRAAGSPAQ